MIEKSLLQDVINIAHEAATQKHGLNSQAVSYVAPDTIRLFQDISGEVERRNPLNADGFQTILDKIDDLNSHDQAEMKVNQLSRLTALDTLVVNAVSSAERATSLSAPQEQIAHFLQDYFEKAADKAAAAEALSGKLDQLIVSLTHTIHPTIYHATEARLFEAHLTELLEDKSNVSATSGKLRLTEEGRNQVAALFNQTLDGKPGQPHEGFIERLALGQISISPKRPTTVSVETQMEKENLKKIRAQMGNVIGAWNKAVGALSVDGLSEVQHAALTISPERAQKMVEFRTWGQSADADGREKSTSDFLYTCIQENLRDTAQGKAYKGLTLDLRQNAKQVHLPFMSALIQKKMVNSLTGRYQDPAHRENGGMSFAVFCKEFMDKREEKYELRKHNGNGGLPWQGPKRSIFQQLDGFNPERPEAEDDRAAFLTEIIKRDYKLIPDQLRVDTLDFNQTMYPVRKEFMKRYEKYIRAAGYDPDTIEYKDMIRVTVPYRQEDPNGPKAGLRPLWDEEVQRHGFEILHSGLQYSRLLSNGTSSAEQLLVKNFLQGTKKLEKDTSFSQGAKKLEKYRIVDLTERDRSTFTDTAKRFFVINDAIDKYGSKVATRYQIANFSEPSDFLTVLKLFQDTGIATIDHGKVKSSKLSIMPLLETGEDLQNGVAIFSQLLDNPVARSFWEARGNQADFMVGHSDGAASVGNFASQWAIYKATRDLTQLFKEHGIKTRFFHGRGRGTDRGGTIDPSLQMDLVSADSMHTPVYDVTIQSDLPMDLAASKPYGEDYLTKILLGTLGASLNSDQRQAEEKRLKAQEEGIEWIAQRSAEIYQDIVRNNNPDGALKVLNQASDNPYKTSRSASRDGAAHYKDFDDVRAIPKEYVFNGIDLQVHNVGLKRALDEYEEKFGEKALGALNEHPFFRAITKTIRAGMAHYDPAVARAHAKPKVLDAEPFVERVIGELDRLTLKLDYITGNMAASLNGNSRPVHLPSRASVLDQIGHAIIVSSLENGKPAHPVISRPDHQRWTDTLYNALFVTAQETGHRELLSQQKSSPGRG